ncbi:MULTISPECIES: hypothetical protein [Plantibacter]|uniref:hypothetical protein n=1 Tax=Plantibacter TaxID=190323 RepID=UPI00254EA813|nr:hypothetical protein [Plantibacter sp. lyk4-40-MEA-4]
MEMNTWMGPAGQPVEDTNAWAPSHEEWIIEIAKCAADRRAALTEGHDPRWESLSTPQREYLEQAADDFLHAYQQAQVNFLRYQKDGPLERMERVNGKLREIVEPWRPGRR